MVPINRSIKECESGTVGILIDLFHFIKNAQIGLLAMIGEQRIMVRAHAPWQVLSSYDGVHGEFLMQSPREPLKKY